MANVDYDVAIIGYGPVEPAHAMPGEAAQSPC